MDTLVSQEEIAKGMQVVRRQEAEQVANTMPLPGPAGDASASGPIQIGKFSVRKIVKFDWRVWQMTDSAIVKSLAELDKAESERSFITDDVSDSVAIWMLTHTCAEVAQALKGGVEKFKEQCSAEVEQVLEVPEFNALFSAVIEQVSRSAATAIKYAADKEGQGETHFFQDSKANPPMVSAG